MFSLKKKLPLGRTGQQASAADFCKVFRQDMDILFWLALALTNDEGKAEQCFVAGLDECMDGNPVFKEWARSWSRRVVIKNAIRLMSPRPGMISPPSFFHRHEKADAPLMRLQPFDRFVFVMSLLEGYKDGDCASLLGCSVANVAEARLRALQQIGPAMEPSSAHPEDRERVVLDETDVA